MEEIKKELERIGFRFVTEGNKFEVQIEWSRESGFLGMGGRYTEWTSLPINWFAKRFTTLAEAIEYAENYAKKYGTEVV